MPGKLTLYPSEGVSRRFVFRQGAEYSLGRDPASDVVLEDPRISARHAVLRCERDEWMLRDSKSKNGTFVNAIRVTEAPLQDGDWVSFGGLLTRFEVVSEEDVERGKSERARRMQTFTEARRILDSEIDPRRLLARLVASVLELTEARRGILILFGPDGRLRAEVVSGFSAGSSTDGAFAGSYGAIERALTTGRAVVTSNAKADAYLGKRPSVIEMGIETLACVALKSGDEVAGLIYVDGEKRGGVFTDLDLEILEALADHASVAVATLNLDRQIREIVGATAAPAASTGVEFLRGLERRMEEIGRMSVSRPSSP